MDELVCGNFEKKNLTGNPGSPRSPFEPVSPCAPLKYTLRLNINRNNFNF